MADTPRSHGRKSIRPSVRPRDLLTPNPTLARAWTAQVITLLPQAFPGVLGESLTGRALREGLWSLDTIDLRDFGEGRHRNVDDTPAGGGAGMVLRADVMGRAIDAASAGAPRGSPLVYLSPRGAPLTQARARSLAAGPGVTLICGRFEGLDQRVIDHYDIEEISLGDFVMTGGEIAAQALIDTCVRLLPGVLGNESSTEEESFSEGLLEHPHYTRPAEWRGHTIPEVLTSGDHGRVAAWRREMSERLTAERRPDLWRARRSDAE
ncbi:tRNA (guanosine(37)-N1)-methyltransferase TrmD [Roseovarius ramblicola]|uniref:tRNA (guanine-N(1)-)-methyltransferase n=1 Tax=Roseovarius ramblicola TaxID=2022336 RepID=A0ABV5I036_9RHOB